MAKQDEYTIPHHANKIRFAIFVYVRALQIEAGK